MAYRRRRTTRTGVKSLGRALVRIGRKLSRAGGVRRRRRR